MQVRVVIYRNKHDFIEDNEPLRDYVIDHNDGHQRAVLGAQVRNAFEAGQVVVTILQCRQSPIQKSGT